MANSYHSIKAVSQRSGLSAHVIRIWEKRYKAAQPSRTESNRRLYSDDDVERLCLLRDATKAGYNIGYVARFSTERLRKLIADGGRLKSISQEPVATKKSAPASPLDDCIAAVKSLDSRKLDHALKRGAAEFGSQGVLHRLIAPLAQQLGELWREGLVTAAHEHFATAVIRVFLAHTAKNFAEADGAPAMVVATPIGQLHELGALLAAAAASNVGWRVTYIGPSLPAAEIAGTALQNRAQAVALSIIYPEDDSRMDSELKRLRELLPEIPILVGGRAMPAYLPILREIGARPVHDLQELCAELDKLRKPSRSAKRKPSGPSLR